MRVHFDLDTQAAEEGSILIWALLFSIITSAMIISHSTFLASNRRAMNARYENVTLSDTFARSGLTDALEWYQRQPTQPVTTFAPQLEPTGDPPRLETLDPTIGLVREFEVRGSLWGRYEVRTDEARDISAERGMETPGTVWDIGARSYLYLRRDPSQPFDAGQNRVVAKSYLRTELQGIGIIPPASAAVTINDPSLLDIGPNARIAGGDRPAIAFPTGLTPPALPADAVAGTPDVCPVIGFDSSPEHVFSMDSDRLASLADYSLLASAIDAASSTEGNGGDGRALLEGTTALDDLAPLSMLTMPPQGGDGSWWSWYCDSHLGYDNHDDPHAFRDYSFAFRRWYYMRFRPTQMPSDDAAENGWRIGSNGDLSSTLGSVSDLTSSLLSSSSSSLLSSSSSSLLSSSSSSLLSSSSSLLSSSSSASDSVSWITGGNRFLPGQGQIRATFQPPATIDDKSVFIQGNLVLGADRPLRGRSLVFVNGNLSVQDDNVSRLRGVLYVAGNADIDGDFRLDGLLIVGGKLRIGYGTQISTIQCSAAAVSEIKSAVERYQLSRTVRPGWATTN